MDIIKPKTQIQMTQLDLEGKLLDSRITAKLPAEPKSVSVYDAAKAREMEVIGLMLKVFFNEEGGFFVSDELKRGIYPKLNDMFMSRGRKVLPEYVNSPIWKDFQYMVVLTDTNDPFNPTKKNFDKIYGIVLAYLLRTKKGVPYVYFCKVGIDSEHQGNGLLRPLLYTSVSAVPYITRKNIPNSKTNLLSALRTSEPQLDLRYFQMSDEGRFKDGYFMHFFGMFDPKTREVYGQHIDDIAEHMTSLPKSVEDLQLWLPNKYLRELKLEGVRLDALIVKNNSGNNWKSIKSESNTNGQLIIPIGI